MKRYIAIIIACIGAILAAWAIATYYLPIYGIQTPVSQNAVRYARVPISLGTGTFNAFVADTETLRTKGLSDFSSLGDGEAMLFVFPTAGNWGIWMKDMDFPIDIVWLDDEKRVVTIKDRAAPESHPEVFYPSASARYVIELPAGSAAEFGIVPGGKTDF